MFNKKIFMLIVTLLSVLISACGNGDAATPPAVASVPLVADGGTVIAEGRLQPRRYAQISFWVGGQVAEILVSESDKVNTGDVIARLKNREALQTEVARAEQEKLDADRALKSLKEDADVVAAEALFDLSQAKDALNVAERNLRNFKNPDMDYHQRQVAKAEDAFKAAQENARILDIGTATANLKTAKDALKYLDDNLTQTTLNAIKSCLNTPCPDRHAEWLDGMGMKLKDARDWYNDALNRIQVAELQLQQAQRNNGVIQRDLQKALNDAKRDLENAKSPDPLKVAIYESEVVKAQARVAQAKRKYEKVKIGPDPDQLASAEARVKTADAALETAKVALSNSELRAPFAGTVVDIKFKVGEQVAPGVVVTTIADLSDWVVKTKNLTEIEVVKLTPGQKAIIKFDSLPDMRLSGTVEAIASFFEEKRGDVTYTVTLGVTDVDPKVRWGMTTQVTFER